MDDTNPKLIALLEEMNNYLDSHGLGGTAKYNAVVDKYLTLAPDVLSKLSAEELGEASYLLSQYATYLQREVNQKRAICDWCDRNISKIITPSIQNYGDQYTNFEYKRDCAVLENPVAKELSIIKGKAMNHLTSLSDIPYRVEKMSDRLSALQTTKRRRYE